MPPTKGRADVRKPHKTIRAAAKPAKIIAFEAPVTIKAAEAEGGKGPAKFNVVAYTGQAMRLKGWEHPVVVDIEGMEFSETLTANLDHDPTKRVGHVTEATKHDGKVLLAGAASAVSAASEEVVASGGNGYPWKASIEADPLKVVDIAKGKLLKANGQSFTGPLHYVPKSLLSGFGFVTRGADSNTSVSIAASAASKQEKAMRTEVADWVKGRFPSVDIEAMTPDEVTNWEADFDGRSGKRTKITASDPATPGERRRIEAKRRTELNELADQWMEKREGDLEWINAIEEMRDHAIEAKQSVQEFRNELYETLAVPQPHTPSTRRSDRGLNNRILEAALCEAGRLPKVDEHFTDQELQAAHERFPHGISLCQFYILAAEANGYRGTSGGKMTLEIQRYAFGMGNGPMRPLHAGAGFSTIDVANITAATANKFIREGWMSVDQTPLRIAFIRSVNNFHQITTVSLTGHLQFEKVGADGEIKHGTLDDMTYTNQADTYAAMLAITRKDMINDDLGALTAVPRRLGRGGMLKLNDIFWTEFLDNSSFFTSGNSNVNEGVADMTLGGLAATEAIFMNQTDPDSKPLSTEPRIILVPTALKATAVALMDPQGVMITGASSTIPNVNPFRGRFRVESSPYMSNSSYTGNSSSAWYMLADPNDIPVIEIVALNGRVEPVVETADANFNVLGTQMRGYNDVGVNLQEYRGGVRADGGSS
jgi:hypothetical protein